MAHATAKRKTVKVEAVDHFAEGSALGPYRVQRFLGAGTFGVVYLVKRGGLGKRKALKLLKQTWLGNEHVLARFQREAHALAELHDENLTQVEELGVIDGRHFIEMEYLEGRSLAKALEEKPRWSLEEALDVVLPVASGLHVAHGSPKRLVHRDLKPDNIFLHQGGGRLVPKVIDFGVAHASGDGEEMTEEGQQIGTRSFMSPEQVRGEPDIDGRADQWALAVVLFVMLTGRRPFYAHKNVHLTDRLITEGATPSLHDDGVTIPAQAEEAMRRALRKEPRERFASLRDFGLALAPYARHETRIRFESRWGSPHEAEDEPTLARPATRSLPRLETAPTHRVQSQDAALRDAPGAPAAGGEERGDPAGPAAAPLGGGSSPDEDHRKNITQPIEGAPKPPVEFALLAPIEPTVATGTTEQPDMLSDAAVERGAPRGERLSERLRAPRILMAIGVAVAAVAIVAAVRSRGVGAGAAPREAGGIARDAAATRDVDTTPHAVVAADVGASVDATPREVVRVDADAAAVMVRRAVQAMRGAAAAAAARGVTAPGGSALHGDAAVRAPRVAAAPPAVTDASTTRQEPVVPAAAAAPDVAQGGAAPTPPAEPVVRTEEGPGGRVRPRLRAPAPNPEGNAPGTDAGGT